MEDSEQTATRVCRVCGYVAEDASAGAVCPEHGGALLLESVHAQFPSDELLGRTLSGKYAVLDVLGRGGMGYVYTAIQLPVGRRVAVKVIRFNPGQDNHDELRGRFFREARVMAQLSGPSTARLYDYGEDGDVLFMALERVPGPSLRQVLKRDAPLDPERAVNLTIQVLDALEEAHDLGLVHRDIKPPNILLAPGPGGGEVAKVLDFGVAKVLDDGAEDEELTRTGVAVGTPRYMAPEQVRREGVGPPADLYALGVVLYEMLSGQTPFHGRRGFDLMTAHVTEAPPPLPAALGLSSDLERVVMRALAKDVLQRYRTAAEMREALRDVVGRRGSEVPTPAPTVLEMERITADVGPETPSSGTSPALGEVSAAPEPEAPGRAPLYVALGLLAVGGAALLAWAVRAPAEAPAPPAVQAPLVVSIPDAAEVAARVVDATVTAAVVDAAPDAAIALAEPAVEPRPARPARRRRAPRSVAGDLKTPGPSRPTRRAAPQEPAREKPAPKPGLLLEAVD